MKKFLISYLSLSLTFFSFLADTKTENSSSDKKPLVLSLSVSHSRNKDSTSLILKKESVELVTNTSSYQKGREVRLGHFKSQYSLDLKTLKEEAQGYYTRLRKTLPTSHLIKDSRLASEEDDPHAPVLSINEETVPNEHSYFKPLSKMIYTIWDKKWVCVHCATYKLLNVKQKTSVSKSLKKVRIIREVHNTTAEPKNKSLKAKKNFFKPEELNCISKGQNKIECIDPQFGIFEL